MKLVRAGGMRKRKEARKESSGRSRFRFIRAPLLVVAGRHVGMECRSCWGANETDDETTQNVELQETEMGDETK
jgi:hypothetical protein